MIQWLHTLSNAQIGLLFLVPGLFISTLIPYFVRRKYRLDPGEHSAKGAEEAFKLFTSITLLLLAFCLVRVQGDHRNTEDLAAREATIVYKLSRALSAFSSEEANFLQVKVRDYAKSVVVDEWPKLERGERSELASRKLAELIQTGRSLEVTTPVQQAARIEILTALTQVADIRDARLAAARLGLPSYYWQALCCSITLLLFFGWFQNPLPKLLAYVGGVTFGVSLLLTMLVVTEGLFVGESRVTPDALIALFQFDNR